MRGEPAIGILAAMAALLITCSRPPEVSWPAGTQMVARVEATRPLLADLVSLQGTPAASWAADLGRRLDELECETVVLSCQLEGGCAALRDLRCSTDADGELVASLGASAWQVRHHAPGVWWGEARWLPGTDHGGELSGEIAVLDESRARWTGLLPASSDGDSAPRLSDDQALLHLRISPQSGLRLPADGERSATADDLFRLRNDLFTTALLAGDLEVAIYQPQPGQLIPPVALAAGVRQGAAAVAAMEAFVADVAHRWSLSRRPWARGDLRGACLDELRVLPNLAPCYLASPEALYIGWSAASLERALVATGDPIPQPASFGDLYLDRLPAADAVLAGEIEEEWQPTVYPWSHLRIDGTQRDGRVQLRAFFTGAR